MGVVNYPQCEVICHPLPSNSQQETAKSMSHVTVYSCRATTHSCIDHYQPRISLKLHIEDYIYFEVNDKIVA